MAELAGLLVTMFFMVVGVAFLGGCLIILLDVVMPPSGDSETERRF